MSNLELTYNSFISRISETGRKDVLFKLTKNILLTLTSFIILALVLVSLEAIFEFSSTVRKVMFFGTISAFAATFVMIFVYAWSGTKELTKPAKVSRYAKTIGSHYPEIKDNLLNAIQIYDYTRRDDHMFSQELAAETINQVNETSKQYNFSNVISFKKNNFLIALFASSFLLFAALML